MYKLILISFAMLGFTAAKPEYPSVYSSDFAAGVEHSVYTANVNSPQSQITPVDHVFGVNPSARLVAAAPYTAAAPYMAASPYPTAPGAPIAGVAPGTPMLPGSPGIPGGPVAPAAYSPYHYQPYPYGYNYNPYLSYPMYNYGSYYYYNHLML